MKPKVLAATSLAILSFLGYKLWGSENAAPSTAKNKSTSDSALESSETGTAADLKPQNIRKPTIGQTRYDRTAEGGGAEENAAEETFKAPEEPMVDSDSGVITVKAPTEREGQPSIVNLVATEGQAAAEREKLDNVAISFSDGKDAVATFGDALNALNGTYVGEITREGKEPCPLSLTIDGLYIPKEGAREADFTGNFQMFFECGTERHSRGSWVAEFGKHVKAIGENANTLILKDGGENYFQISFSKDFQSVTGYAYETPRGSPAVYFGSISAHR